MSSARAICSAAEQALFRRVYGLDCSLTWTPEPAQRTERWRAEADDLTGELSLGAFNLHESRLAALLGDGEAVSAIRPDDDDTPAIALPGGELITVVEAQKIIDATHVAIARISQLLCADGEQRPAP